MGLVFIHISQLLIFYPITTLIGSFRNAKKAENTHFVAHLELQNASDMFHACGIKYKPLNRHRSFQICMIHQLDESVIT